jgi:hypothetical protein
MDLLMLKKTLLTEGCVRTKGGCRKSSCENHRGRAFDQPPIVVRRGVSLVHYLQASIAKNELSWVDAQCRIRNWILRAR